MAQAQAEGYFSGKPTRQQHPSNPYKGYFYHILKQQGKNAPGGAKDYLVNGRMTGGFALLAYPAKWGYSGIMSFIVNQDGIVHQKNLGPQTEELAPKISAYDPDGSWTKIK